MSDDQEKQEKKSHPTGGIGWLLAISAVLGALGVNQVFPDLVKRIISPSTPQPSSPVTPSVSPPIQSSDPSPTPSSPSPPEPKPTPTPSPTPSSSSSSLEGKYSLAWFQDSDKNTSGCWKTGSIADLTISSDGFMQGHLANNSPNHRFSGKVNSDGTWSATLLGGYQFSGTMKDGALSGRYTAPNGNSNETTQCKGTVSGFKQSP